MRVQLLPALPTFFFNDSCVNWRARPWAARRLLALLSPHRHFSHILRRRRTGRFVIVVLEFDLTVDAVIAHVELPADLPRERYGGNHVPNQRGDGARVRDPQQLPLVRELLK